MTRETLRAALATQKATPRRDRVVAVRVTEAEHRLLFATAKREGIPPSTLAHLLLVAGLAELSTMKGGKAAS
jgi:hypothetical protein